MGTVARTRYSTRAQRKKLNSTDAVGLLTSIKREMGDIIHDRPLATIATTASSQFGGVVGQRSKRNAQQSNHLTTAADLILASPSSIDNNLLYTNNTTANGNGYGFSSYFESTTNVPLPSTSTGEPTFSSSRLLDRSNSIRPSYGVVGSSSDSAASLPSPTSPAAAAAAVGRSSSNNSGNTSTNNSGTLTTGGGSYAAIYNATKQQRRVATSATPLVATSLGSDGVARSNDRVVVTSVTSSTSSNPANHANNNHNDHDTDNELTTTTNASLPRHRIAVSYPSNDEDNQITAVITPAPLVQRNTSNTSSDGVDDAYAADFEDFEDDKTLLGVAPLAAIGSLPPASPEVPAHTLNGSTSNNRVRPQTDRNTMHKALLNLKSKSSK
jgi:hypothetical protein